MLNKLLSFLWPVQWLMQKLGKKEPAISALQVDALLASIEPGDILLSYESQRFTSMFIKGEFDHAAIVSDATTVVEAVAPISREVALAQWLYNKDSVAVLRANLPLSIRTKVANYSRMLTGVAYDYSFLWKDKRLYCSELVLKSFVEIHPQFLHSIDKNNLLPIQYLDIAAVGADMYVVLVIKNH